MEPQWIKSDLSMICTQTETSFSNIAKVPLRKLQNRSDANTPRRKTEKPEREAYSTSFALPTIDTSNIGLLTNVQLVL